MKTILKIENLYKSFADSLVLQDISFEVSKGEVLCLIGPSGSGKTTLIRCINFLESRDSGNIYLEDKLLGYDQKNGKLIKQNEYKISKDRSEIGMVFQKFNLFPHLTAIENISIGPKKVLGKISEVGINCEIDLKNHNLNYKIREHSMSKIPLLLICGKKEVDSNSITIRRLDSKKQETMELKNFLKKFSALNKAPSF